MESLGGLLTAWVWGREESERLCEGFGLKNHPGGL